LSIYAPILMTSGTIILRPNEAINSIYKTNGFFIETENGSMDLEIIDNELEEKLIKMTKFRNLLGHLYMEINNEKIYEILQNNLNDFNLFKKHIISRFKAELINENNK